MKCGCRIEQTPITAEDGVVVSFTSSIVYCALHAAAEEMREALRKVVSHLLARGAAFPGHPDGASLLQVADAALRASEVRT